MAHQDIRIKFTVDGRDFEAVGWLAKGEDVVTGDEMLARTATENGGAVGDDDEAFLGPLFRRCWTHSNDLFPAELKNFWLMTNRRDPRDPRCISGFINNGGRLWLPYWQSLDRPRGWGEFALVLRRV